ncbi:MAG: hypothetical protein FWG61_06760 [Firmicutes bacterium]|nr:hypothetical protein [Bacillota bacterium]
MIFVLFLPMLLLLACLFALVLCSCTVPQTIGYAFKPYKTVYYQATATMLAEETRERELRALRAIDDNYGKIVLSMDQTPLTDYDGIKNIYLPQWLIGEK